MKDFIQLLQTIDEQLPIYVTMYGEVIYFIIFMIVFCKTAFVVTAFLPGDSLAFASGTLAAASILHLPQLTLIVIIAAILGDSNNFALGRLFSRLNSKQTLFFRLIPKVAFAPTERVLDRTTITYSRFIPVLRVIIPFRAGYTKSSYFRFLRLNSIGALCWTSVWLGSGFALGNIPVVQQNLALSLFILTITMITFSAIAYVRSNLIKNQLS